MAYGDNGIENAWLIEDKNGLYFNGSCDGWGGAISAIRFSRREDAWRCMNYLRLNANEYKATSHEWG
jgi:hypothetical protein